MAADEDNKEQVLKECEQTEEVMKDKQNQVKRKNYWVLLKIDLHLLVLQWGMFHMSLSNINLHLGEY